MATAMASAHPAPLEQFGRDTFNDWSRNDREAACNRLLTGEDGQRVAGREHASSRAWPRQLVEVATPVLAA